jgi:hypothetical protein
MSRAVKDVHKRGEEEGEDSEMDTSPTITGMAGPLPDLSLKAGKA